MWREKDHVIASYSIQATKLFDLLFELQSECGHVSSVLNRPEMLDKMRALVDEDCRIRRVANGLPELIPFRVPDDYASLMRQWEDSLQHFDPDDTP